MTTMARRTGIKGPPDSAHYGALDERVYALAAQISSVQKDVHDLRSTMASSHEVAALAMKIDGMVAQYAERARPQWQVIFSGFGVVLAVLTTIGWLAYKPINEDIADLKDIVKADLSSQATRFVPRSEIEQRWTLADERYAETQADVHKLSEDVYGNYTLKDALDTLSRRVDRIQSGTDGFTRN